MILVTFMSACVCVCVCVCVCTRACVCLCFIILEYFAIVVFACLFLPILFSQTLVSGDKAHDTMWEKLKEEGNQHFKSGDLKGAIKMYTLAIQKFNQTYSSNISEYDLLFFIHSMLYSSQLVFSL